MKELDRETSLLMDAAMCLWEAFCDVAFTSHHLDTPIREKIEQSRGDVGTAECRYAVKQAVPALEEAWDMVEDVYGPMGCFDWTFCPWFLENCMQWGYGVKQGLRDDWHDIAAEYAAEIREQVAERGHEYGRMWVVAVGFADGTDGTLMFRAPSEAQAEFEALRKPYVSTVYVARQEGDV